MIGGMTLITCERGLNMAKKNEKETKKTSKKKQGIARYKWLKVVYFKLDDLEERIELLEKFLGGRESMKKVLEEQKELEY